MNLTVNGDEFIKAGREKDMDTSILLESLADKSMP